MINKRGLVLVLVILLISPLALALDTKINIHAGVGKVVTLKLLNEDTGKILDTGDYGDLTIGGDGQVSIVYSSNIQNKIKISLIMRPKMQTYYIFSDVKTGWIYDIYMGEGDPTIKQVGKVAEENGTIETKTAVVSNETTETKTETKTNSTVTVDSNNPVPVQEVTKTESNTNSITGAVIGSFANKKTYIYLGIALIILIGVIFSFTFVRNSSQSNTYARFKYNKDNPDDSDSLEEVEQKLEQVNEALKRVRERSKPNFVRDRRSPQNEYRNEERRPNDNNNLRREERKEERREQREEKKR